MFNNKIHLDAIEPIYIPNYSETLVRYYSDQNVGLEYNDKLFEKDITLKNAVTNDLSKLDLNVTKHIPITLLSNTALIRSAISSIGLYAEDGLFDIMKSTEHIMQYGAANIISMTLFELLIMVRATKNEPSYNSYCDILSIFPKEFSESLGIESIKSKSRLRVPTHPTYESRENILIIDDLNNLDTVIESQPSTISDSTTLLSKIFTLTVRIKLPDIYSEFIDKLNYYIGHRSARMSIVTNTQRHKAGYKPTKYLYLTANLSDYKLLFNNWKDFIDDDNCIIPFLYYCIKSPSPSKLNDIIKISDKSSEDRLYNFLVNDDKMRGKFHV